MGLFDFLKKGTGQPDQSRLEKKIIKRFYADYQEKPYISPERNADWLKMAESMPKQSLVKKEMMKRYKDKLLPGHVYMLYWLKKYTNKQVPAYFEYKYGVDFEKELLFLRENGFLNQRNKPTEKGEQAIEQHFDIIEAHKPPKRERPVKGAREQIIEQRDWIREAGFHHFEFVANKDCCEICAALNGQHFAISKLRVGVNAPPMHEGCRCSIAAWEDDSKYEAWLDSISKR